MVWKCRSSLPRIPGSSVEVVLGSFLVLQNQEIKTNLRYVSGYIRDAVLVLSDGILSFGAGRSYWPAKLVDSKGFFFFIY